VLPFLRDNGINRASRVAAVGGGIIQDIASFSASIFMRGIPWTLYPTTLLAQSDSCIGSKSSINFDTTKNVLGTFYPAEQVVIDHLFLDTLSDRDIVSGIGEIVKVHFLKGKKASLSLQADMAAIRARKARALDQALYASLLIKKEYIEQDEFDVGIRNLLNYGHCFGHALEAGSQYAIPHGIGVLYGMEVANRLSYAAGYVSAATYQQMHDIIRPLLVDQERARATTFPMVLPHLKKDKKNVGGKISFILTHGFGRMKKHVGIKPADIERAWAALLSQV
jgi:3-dehydroquinate synthase